MTKKNSIFIGKYIVVAMILTGFVILYFLLPKLDKAQHQPKCSIPCKVGGVCMNTPFLWTSILDVTCVSIPKKSPIVDIKLPFAANAKVYCTHALGVGTHSWPNAYWALDLATPYNEPNATIYASADGVAYVSQAHCTEPKGFAAQAQISSCGEGFGNWVKVYHGGGYYTFYAHLDSVLVKNGSFVHQGQAIGLEGWTGNAGHRHLHWSVQKLPGATETQWKHKIINYVGESVPFKFIAVQDNKVNIFDTAIFQCEHADIGTSINSQPTFKGMF